MGKKASQATLDSARKATLLRLFVQGRTSASSSSLSRSYAVPVEEVRAILRSANTPRSAAGVLLDRRFAHEATPTSQEQHNHG